MVPFFSDQWYCFGVAPKTYIWIVTNNKQSLRKGKVQLVNATEFSNTMKKSLGSKRKFITEEQRSKILETYLKYEENGFSKIYPNEFFGYTKITVELPLVEDGKLITDRSGNPKPNTALRDYERVPLLEDADEYFEREVRPHLPNAWMDRGKDKVGYEINFTKYFYQYKPLRSLEEITIDLLKLEEESEGIFKQIIENQ